MEGLQQAALSTLTVFGTEIQYDPTLFYMTWLVMTVLIVLFLLGTKTLRPVPKKGQNIAESVVDFLKDIVYSTLGPKDGRRFLPLIIATFTFVLLSNWIGIFPNIFKFIGTLIALASTLLGSSDVTLVANGITQSTLQISPSAWYSFLFGFPDFQEPTRSMNTDFALAIFIFIAVHAFGIKEKGIANYLGSYMDPVPAKLPYTLFFFLNPFFYLNIIGTISGSVSHAFRLFGNLFGGFMIITIVSGLLKYFVVPVALNAYFGLFSGLVQAFVFTMLTITYIAQQK